MVIVTATWPEHTAAKLATINASANERIDFIFRIEIPHAARYRAVVDIPFLIPICDTILDFPLWHRILESGEPVRCAVSLQSGRKLNLG
jgi:hypothetical protein